MPTENMPQESIRQIGQYALVEKLSENAFGEHFLAQHMRLEKLVRFTLLPSEVMSQPDAASRFEADVKKVGQLTHANLARISDVGEAGGDHYLVTEHVDGVTLRALVENTSALDVSAACEVARQFTMGLDATSQQSSGVGAIPLETVIADGDDAGNVTVYGLGLAWLDPAKDPFADVARVLCFALSADGTTQPDLDFISQLAQHRNDLSEELLVILQRLVSPTDSERFSSLAEVADALAPISSRKRLVAQMTGQTLSTVNLVRPIKAAERRRKIWPIFAALLLICASVVAAVVYLSPDNSPDPLANDSTPNVQDANENDSSDTHVINPPIENENPEPSENSNDAPTDPPPWKPGVRTDVLPGFVPHPAEFPGVGRWQVFTKQPRGGIGEIRWSPDGSMIACTVYAEKSIRIYDAETYELLKILPMTYATGGSRRSLFHWSPDGQWIAAADSDGIQLWRPDGTRGIKIASRPYRSFYNLAWSPDSKQIAAGEATGDMRFVNIDGSSDIAIGFAKDFDKVGTIAWSDDGKWLAAGCDEDRVQVWRPDSSAGAVIEGHEGDINGVAWKPGENSLATCSDDGTVRIWELGSFGKEIQKIEAHKGKVTAVSWRPNGEGFVTSGEDRKVRYWKINSDDNTAEMTEVAEMRPVHQNRVHWNKAGDTVVMCPAGYGSFRLFKFQGEAASEKLQHFHVDLPYCEGTAAWHPDGTKFVAGFSIVNDNLFNGNRNITGIIRFFNHDGSDLHRLTRELPKATCVAWTPSSERIVTGGRDGVVRIWSADGEQLQSYTGHQQWIKDVAVHPSGQPIASLANGGNTRVWNDAGQSTVVFDKLPASQSPHFGYIQSIDFHPDGNQIAATFEKGVRVVNWRSKSPSPIDLVGHQGWVGHVAWNKNGETIASLGYSFDKTLRFWTADGSEKTSVEIKTRYQPHVFAWDPSGTRVVLADDYFLRFVSLNGTESTPFKEPHFNVQAIAWKPDGSQFAAAKRDQILLFDADGKMGPELMDSRSLAQMFSLDWSSDGRWIAGGGPHGVGIWNAETQTLNRILVPLPNEKAISFSPAGQVMFATPGATDELIYVVERQGGRLDIASHDEFYERVLGIASD